MIKLYLDTKDYINIAKSYYSSDRATINDYQRLLRLVESGCVRVYFSWCHVHEATKFRTKNRKIYDIFALTVDSVLKNNCLKHTALLEECEYNYCVKLIRNEMDLRPREYAYGLGLDAILNFATSGRGIDFISRMRRRIDELNLPETIKQYCLDKIDNEDAIKQTISESIYKDFELYSSWLPIRTEHISPNDIVSLLVGEEEERQSALYTIFSNGITFGDLIRIYQFGWFDFETINTNLLKGFDGLLKMVVDERLVEMNEADFDYLISKCEDGYFRNVEKKIASEIHQNNLIFSPKSFRVFFKSKRAFMALCEKYLDGYRRNAFAGRVPVSNDVIDMFHLSHAPFVDVISTDNFFYSLLKQESGKMGAEVVNGLKMALDVIDQRLQS